MSPYRNPTEVLVTRADLLPVQEDTDGSYLFDGVHFDKTEAPAHLRGVALKFLSAAIRLEDDEAKKAEQEAKQWELEHAVPLARMMYNTFHKSSDNYKDDASEELWLQRYGEGDHLVKKWVRVATDTLKAQLTP